MKHLIHEGKRRCRICKIIYPLSKGYFNSKPRDAGGLGYICKECARKASREWRKKHPEVVKRNLELLKSNPRYIKHSRKNYREKLKHRRLRLRFKVLERDNFTCQYCGRKASEVELQIDHVLPKSKGGQDRMKNYITACKDCNLGKGDYILKEFE